MLTMVLTFGGRAHFRHRQCDGGLCESHAHAKFESVLKAQIVVQLRSWYQTLERVSGTPPTNGNSIQQCCDGWHPARRQSIFDPNSWLRSACQSAWLNRSSMDKFWTLCSSSHRSLCMTKSRQLCGSQHKNECNEDPLLPQTWERGKVVSMIPQERVQQAVFCYNS